MARRSVRDLGLEVYPRRVESSPPTVTAVKVPERIGWPELDRRLRARGVGVGKSYCPLAGRVFRLGHVGTQADERLVRETLDALRQALAGQ